MRYAERTVNSLHVSSTLQIQHADLEALLRFADCKAGAGILTRIIRWTNYPAFLRKQCADFPPIPNMISCCDYLCACTKKLVRLLFRDRLSFRDVLSVHDDEIRRVFCNKRGQHLHRHCKRTGADDIANK